MAYIRQPAWDTSQKNIVPHPSEHPSQTLSNDPLREATRRKRRSLLAVSLVVIALIWTGKVPNQIAALGLEFSQPDQAIVLWIVGLVNFYFFIGFLLYAAQDLLSWRIVYKNAWGEWQRNDQVLFAAAEAAKQALKDRLITKSSTPIIDEYGHPKPGYRHVVAARWVRGSNLSFRVSMWIRLLFDFCVPFMVGGYAVYLSFVAPSAFY